MDNFYELFNGLLNPKQLEGLRLLVSTFPQQQFNSTEDRRFRTRQPRSPGVDPGQPFPATPLQPVNSPVEVAVNGKPAEVLYAGGYPNAVDRYQVNFRIPDGTVPGVATIRLTSGFIPGSDVMIPIQ